MLQIPKSGSNYQITVVNQLTCGLILKASIRLQNALNDKFDRHLDPFIGIPYPLDPFFAYFFMDKVALKASPRTSDESLVEMRKKGKIPGIVYGNTPNMMLQFDEVELRKAYVKAGESTLVELDADGKKLPVLRFLTA